MDKDVTSTFLPQSADDARRRERVVAILAAGVARLLAGDAVKPGVDLSANVRVTTTTAQPGGGDES